MPRGRFKIDQEYLIKLINKFSNSDEIFNVRVLDSKPSYIKLKYASGAELWEPINTIEIVEDLTKTNLDKFKIYKQIYNKSIREYRYHIFLKDKNQSLCGRINKIDLTEVKYDKDIYNLETNTLICETCNKVWRSKGKNNEQKI